MHSLFALIPLLIYLGMIVFVIYFMVKVLEFLRTKTNQDAQLGKKLDRLIEAIEQQKKTAEKSGNDLLG